jgi:hypothetical protein
MIPDRPIPPENPDMPKRGQISLDTLRKESVETNLWNLESDSPSLRANVIPTPRSIQQSAPPPEKQDPYASLVPPAETHDFSSPAEQPDTPAADARPGRPQPMKQLVETPPLLDDLEDLDDFEDLATSTLPPTATPAPSEAVPTPVTDPIPTSVHSSNRRKSMFSRPEVVGISVVGLLLALCAAYFLFNAFRDLPRIVDPHEMPDFPIKGQYVTLTAADSYWRLPVTTGPNPDVVQRGTRLIPVIEVVARSENATMRVQFRNSEGTPVGDPVTVPIRGNPIINIPSTSGFEDINIHNAYSIGMVEPWSVEILEAPASSTSGGAFRVLASFPISTARR